MEWVFVIIFVLSMVVIALEHTNAYPEGGVIVLTAFISILSAFSALILFIESSRKQEEVKNVQQVTSIVAVEKISGTKDTLTITYPQGAALGLHEFDNIPSLGWELKGEHGQIKAYVIDFSILNTKQK